MNQDRDRSRVPRARPTDAADVEKINVPIYLSPRSIVDPLPAYDKYCPHPTKLLHY